MKVYIFQAALLCETCGKKTCDELRGKMHAGFVEADENTFDSDDFPKGPYENGGGEADSPQHCDDCHVFLENPLTREGVEYAELQIYEYKRYGSGNPATLSEWADFYRLQWPGNSRE